MSSASVFMTYAINLLVNQLIKPSQTKKGKVKSQLALSHSPFSNGEFPNFIREMETNK
jgi:hypothetical protein